MIRGKGEVMMQSERKGIRNKSLTYIGSLLGSENRSPHQLRKRIHFGTGYRNAPPPIEQDKIKGDQEGCRLDQNRLLTGFDNTAGMIWKQVS